MHWKGNALLKKRGHTMFYSCVEKVHQFGTGFIVKNLCKHLVIVFKPFNPRICTLRIKGKFFNYTLINAYAPIEAADEEQKLLNKKKYFMMYWRMYMIDAPKMM
jgi:hypothetical protein